MSLTGPWRLYDEAYRRFHRLEDLPVDGTVFFRLGRTRYRGRSLALSDGTVIRSGDPVGTLHLHNEALAALHCHHRSAWHVGLAFYQGFRATLRELTRRVAENPQDARLVAFCAATIFWNGAEHAGFDVRPLRSRLWAAVVGAYQRALLGRYHPLGPERASQGWERGRYREARVIWISRAGLLARYGARSAPSETGA